MINLFKLFIIIVRNHKQEIDVVVDLISIATDNKKLVSFKIEK
jgi:hypothetical protein